MKGSIKRFLHKKGLYYPVRYSRLFHLYQLLFKPAVIQQQQREIIFYRSFLPACTLIFDIGANDGHKTEAFLSLAEKVVCCEPDTENFRLLQARFRNKKEKVILENTALSDQKGMATLHIHHPGSAFNTLSNKWMKVLEEDDVKRWEEKIQFSSQQTVETTTLDRLIEQYGLPGFIKMDVEGFEETVLKGLSRPVPYLSFETLLPDYAGELRNCLDKIDSLDHSATYNIALQEKLVLANFVNRDELNKWIGRNNNAGGFEIIVKMSI